MTLDTTIKFRFHKYPFVILTSGMCLGIVFGFSWKDWSDLFLMISATFFTTSIILALKGIANNGIVYLLSFFAFVFIGVIHIQEKENLGKDYSLKKIYRKNDPVFVRLTDVGNSNKEWKKMTGMIHTVIGQGNQYSVNEPVVLYVKSDNFTCESGDELLISSDLLPIANSNNPGEFDSENYWKKQGYKYMLFVNSDQFKIINTFEQNRIVKCLSTLHNYLNSALERNLQGRELAIAKALILGDKSLLDTETRNSFSNTGAMHVLAVSGLHVGIIMQILLFLFGQFSAFISKKTSFFIVVGILWIYAVLTGLSPSVLRAVFMFSVLAYAQISSKNYNSVNTLFFTAFVILLFNPYNLFDIGFQLSFLAMLGIFLFYKPIEQLVFLENKILRKIWQGTAIGFAAQLMTTPLSLYYFHQFPNYFFLTNIGLMATSGLIMGAGLFLFSIAWWNWTAGIIGGLLTSLIFISLYFIEWIEKLPGAVAQGFVISPFLVLSMCLLILFLFFLAHSKVYKMIGFSLGLLCLGLISFSRFENLSTNELVVFNSRQLVVAVRCSDNIYCFYKADEGDFEKVKFVLESYQKLHPAKIKYFSLDKSGWKLNSANKTITAEKLKESYVITVGKKRLQIQKYDKEYKPIKNTTVLGMPWVETRVNYSLKHGAFRMRI